MKKTLPCLTAIPAFLIAFAGATYAFEPVSWQFGSDFDGDGGFLLQGVADTSRTAPHPYPNEWEVTPDSLRYELPPHENPDAGSEIAEAGALVQVPGLGGGNQQDFTIELTGEIHNLTWSFARIGILVLSDDQMGVTYAGTDGYSGHMRRPNSGSAELRIGNVSGGDWSGIAADSFVRVDDGEFMMTLTGIYDDEGALIMTLTILVEGEDEVYSITTDPIENPKDGDYFGIAMRLGSTETGGNLIDFHSLSISEAEPRIFMPFQTDLGSAEGRVPGTGFSFTAGDEVSIEDQALRFTGQGEDYRPSLATASLGNFAPGRDFALRSHMTLTNLDSSSADNAVGHVVLGDINPAAPEAASYYHAQWIPNSDNGSVLRIREGVAGLTLEEVPWPGSHPSPDDPESGIGSTYTLQTTGEYLSTTELELTFTLTDESGVSESVSTVISSPLEGEQFGFGAWHRAAEDPVWDFHDIGMADLGTMDFALFEAPFDLNFGTASGRDGLEGLLLSLPRPEDWELQSESLRYERNEGGFQTSSVTAVVGNIVPGQDFTLQSNVELGFLSGGNLNRVGFVVLGREHDPFGTPFDSENDNLYYSLQWLPRTSGDESTLRIRRGLNGSDVTSSVTWEGVHPDDVDPSAGWGEVFEMDANGEYDSETGALTLSFTLTDATGHSQTITAEIDEPLEGNVFGLGARMRSDELPQFFFENFAMSVGDAPVPDVPTFAAWQEDYFDAEQQADSGISGPEANPAGDGVANLLKYSANLSPWTVVSPGEIATVGSVDGDLTLTYHELTGVEDIEYTVETSTDLINWESGPEHVEELLREDQGEVHEVTARAILPENASSGFMRLLISMP